MNNSQFSIFEVVRNAYRFAGREWLYLLRAGFLPMVMQVGTSWFTLFQREDASRLEGYLWGLPATVLFAWFVFVETRLLLLGERLDRLPKDLGYLRERQHDMKVSVITYLLFNMGISGGIVALLVAAESGQWGVNWPLTLAGLFALGAVLWGVRFGIAPILAAVRYPLRPVLRQVQGIMFSLRLIAMGMVCLFPVAFVFQLLLGLLIKAPADPAVAVPLTSMEQAILVTVSAPFSLVVVALLNAAATYALKKILGAKHEGVLV